MRKFLAIIFPAFVLFACGEGPTKPPTYAQLESLRGEVESLILVPLEIHEAAHYDSTRTILLDEPYVLVKLDRKGNVASSKLYYVDTLGTVSVDPAEAMAKPDSGMRHYDIIENGHLRKRIVMDSTDSLRRLLSFEYSADSTLSAASALNFRYKRTDLERIFETDKPVIAERYDYYDGKTRTEYAVDDKGVQTGSTQYNPKKGAISFTKFNKYGSPIEISERDIADTSKIITVFNSKFRGGDDKYRIKATVTKFKGDSIADKVTYTYFIENNKNIKTRLNFLGIIPITFKDEFNGYGDVVRSGSKSNPTTTSYLYDNNGNWNYREVRSGGVTDKIQRFINYYE